MMNGNLYAELAASAARRGRKPLFVEKSEVRLRYDELDDRVGRYANRLRDLGARRGDRIVVQVEKSVENVLLYLAALRCGIIYVPLNTAYSASEVAFFVDDTEPALIVCGTSNAEGTRSISQNIRVETLDVGGGGSLLHNLGPDSGEVARVDAEDVACILYTSGTTGRSKGAMLTHANLSSNMRTLHEVWRWRGDDVLIHALPIYHVHGLFVALHGALYAGATVLFHRRFDAEAVASDLAHASVLMGVPTFYTRLVESSNLDEAVCRGMRLFISGSAPLLEETFERFRQRTGHVILERYGMTETGMITSNPYDGARVAGTVGYPLPGIEVRVVADGEPVEFGHPGTLEVRGPNVFKGYWRMPEKTAEEFTADGFFVTGDIAVQASDGRVSLVGRAKDLIISGGLNIYPKEIELKLDAVPGVAESAVIGLPHADLGEAPAAIVVCGEDEVSEAELREAVNDIARFKQPRSYLFVDSLPRNAMGKVQKAELRRRYSEHFS